MTEEELKQRARDIAADQYHQQEWDRSDFPEEWDQIRWRQHIAAWCRYMRSGAYDNDLNFKCALAALKDCQR